MLYEASIIQDNQRILSCVGERDLLRAWIHAQLENYIYATAELRCLTQQAKLATYAANPHFD